MDPQIAIDPKTAGALMAFTAALTEIFIRVTPQRIVRRLHGAPTSIIVGILASVFWALVYHGTSIGGAVIRGVFVGLAAAGSWDVQKTTRLHIKKLNGQDKREGGDLGVE